MGECLSRGLLGDTEAHQERVTSSVVPKQTILFLFNYTRKKIYGAYVAVDVGELLEPQAWCNVDEKFPSQARIKLLERLPPIPQRVYQNVLEYIPNHPLEHFYLDLDEQTTMRLMSAGRKLANGGKPTGGRVSTNPRSCFQRTLFCLMRRPERDDKPARARSMAAPKRFGADYSRARPRDSRISKKKRRR